MKKLFILFLLSLLGVCCFSQSTVWSLPAFSGNLHGTKTIYDVSATSSRSVTFDVIEQALVSDSLFASYAYSRKLGDSILSVVYTKTQSDAKYLTASGGVNTQLAYFTAAGALASSSLLTFDGTYLTTNRTLLTGANSGLYINGSSGSVVGQIGQTTNNQLYIRTRDDLNSDGKIYFQNNLANTDAYVDAVNKKLVIPGVTASGTITSTGILSAVNFQLSGTLTGASGTAVGANAYQTINQSGTAGYKGIWVSIFESATGSGQKALLDVGTNTAALEGGTHNSKLLVESNGNVTLGGITGSGNAYALLSSTGLISRGLDPASMIVPDLAGNYAMGGAFATTRLYWNNNGGTSTYFIQNNSGNFRYDGTTHNFWAGNVNVFNLTSTNQTFLTKVTLAAGTTTVAPVVMPSGTTLATAIAGAMEYDGKSQYFTPMGTQRGVVPSTQFVTVPSGTVSLASATGLQAVFASANDEVSLSANTTYRFEGVYFITKGAVTTCTVNTGFTFTTGTITSINYWANGTSAGLDANATGQTVYVDRLTSTGITNTGTAVSAVIHISGVIVVSTAGTLMPQIAFSAAPGGTNTVNAGSYFEIWPVGADTVTAVGAWQ